jgi:hypothetical protein
MLRGGGGVGCGGGSGDGSRCNGRLLMARQRLDARTMVSKTLVRTRRRCSIAPDACTAQVVLYWHAFVPCACVSPRNTEMVVHQITAALSDRGAKSE